MENINFQKDGKSFKSLLSARLGACGACFKNFVCTQIKKYATFCNRY